MRPDQETTEASCQLKAASTPDFRIKACLSCTALLLPAVGSVGCFLPSCQRFAEQGEASGAPSPGVSDHL